MSHSCNLTQIPCFSNSVLKIFYHEVWMASDLPSWNLLCSTSFIQLTSRKPSGHHFLIHPAYFFLQHPSFLQHVTIFKIHLFCDATLPTDCWLYGLSASLLCTHVMIKSWFPPWLLPQRADYISSARNLSKSLKSILKKLHCVQQQKDTAQNQLQLLHRVTPYQSYPIPWWTHLLIGLCSLYFLITVQTLLIHSTQHMQNDLETHKQPNSSGHLWCCPTPAVVLTSWSHQFST